ncbi:MAG: class I SAM-dependent methyltransferase [Deltaproteobacteria bacterium]|nr:class I SAM-dependent methyltransferase [Deltaproteobacteria bacterium]
MGLLFKLADNRNPRSLAGWLRRRRSALLRDLLASVPRPARVLDVGGTQAYWEVAEAAGLEGVTVVLLNRAPPVVTRPGFESRGGDARAMPELADQSFDVVFSNSVIEHVGDRDDQRAMASEVRRVGKRYFIQTPNRHFPIEPHFLVPGFQFLPLEVRVQLVMRFSLGWYARTPDRAAAHALATSIELLTGPELAALFPGATIHRERFAGLTKSLIAIGGFA